MTLGKISHIVRGVKDHDAAVEFYTKIGFVPLESGNIPTKFTLFTDGQMRFLLSQDTMTYTGLIYFDNDQTERVKQLEADGTSFFWKQEDEETGKISQAMFEIIPNTFGINLVSNEYPITELPKPEFSLGLFGEFSIPTDDFQKVAEILEPLGFKSTGSFTEPYPWGILYDGVVPIGVHQTDEFNTNTLTYFSINAVETVEKLKEEGMNVKLQGEMGGTLTAPDGQKIFIFKASEEEIIQMRNMFSH